MDVGKFGFDAEVVVLVMNDVLELDSVTLLVERLELVLVLEDDVTLVPVIKDVLEELEIEIELVDVRLILMLLVLVIEVFVLVLVLVLELVLMLELELELTLLLVLEITLVLVLAVCPPAIPAIIHPTKTINISCVFFFIIIVICILQNFRLSFALY